MVVEDESKVMGAGEFFGMLGENAEFSFVRGNIETPGTEPLRDVVYGSLEVGNGPGTFATESAWQGAVQVGVVGELWAGNVFRDEIGKV